MHISLRTRFVLRAMYRAGLVGGIGYLATTLDGHALLAALRRVPVAALVAGAACAFVNLFGKGTSWWLLLGPGERPPLLALWGVHLRSAASSIVMPLRAGEGLRLFWLRRQYRIPMPTLVAVALAEKLINVATLVLLACAAASCEHVPLPQLLHGRATVYAGALACAAVLLLLVLLRRRLGRAGAPLQRLLGRGFGPWLLSCGCATVGWLGDSLLVWLMAQAVGVYLAPGSAPLVLLGINLGIALPSTPGHVGTMELAAGASLGAYGASREAALSFALLYHSVQVLPVLAAAGLNVAWRRFAGGATTHPTTPAPPQNTRADT